VLNPFSPPEPGFEAFRGALRELGYVEGRNLVFEIRWAHGRLDRLPELARELVPLKPDVIFAPGEQGLRAAKDATTTTDTPIVVVACDPLDQLIKSLARPGGSATGLSCIHSELAGKRLEMLKELVPSLTRIAVLFNPSDPNKRLEFEQVKEAGRRLGLIRRSQPFLPSAAKLSWFSSTHLQFFIARSSLTRRWSGRCLQLSASRSLWRRAVCCRTEPTELRSSRVPQSMSTKF
jgi:hypothetical protein